jgi:hypothetical protein
MSSSPTFEIDDEETLKNALASESSSIAYEPGIKILTPHRLSWISDIPISSDGKFQFRNSVLLNDYDTEPIFWNDFYFNLKLQTSRYRKIGAFIVMTRPLPDNNMKAQFVIKRFSFRLYFLLASGAVVTNQGTVLYIKYLFSLLIQYVF